MKDKQNKEKVDYERYWRAFESETGEKVATKAMGQWREASGNEFWGLLILTDRSLRFRHMPGKAWISTILPSARSPSGSDETLEILMPLGLVDLLTLPRRGFRARLMGPPWPSFTLSWREGPEEGAATRTETFTVNDNEGFIAALGRAIGQD